MNEDMQVGGVIMENEGEDEVGGIIGHDVDGGEVAGVIIQGLQPCL
jgi:hypothetical protein